MPEPRGVPTIDAVRSIMQTQQAYDAAAGVKADIHDSLMQITLASNEWMRKAIEDAVRWHYYDISCVDGSDGYEGRGIDSAVLAALEACIPGDIDQLKTEAAQWSVLWNACIEADTWEEARPKLVRPGDGNDG